MPGSALAARVRRHHPALRTIFFADGNEDEAPVGCDLLMRPFTREDLLAAMALAATNTRT
jgi:hypothetical protein